MNTKNYYGTLSVVCMLGVGCQNVPAAESLAPESLPASLSAAPLETYAAVLSVPERTSQEVASRAGLIAAAMLQREVAAAIFERQESPAGGDTRFAGDEAAGVQLIYEPAFDTFRVINARVSADYADPTDIGEASARDVYRTTAAALGAAGALELAGLAIENPRLQLQVQGEGPVGEPAKERVKEYVFFARREVGGASIRHEHHDAGLQISVHRNGAVASVRVSGPSVGSGAPTALTSALSEEAADQLAQKEYVNHTVESQGLCYVLDDASNSFRLRWTYKVSAKTVIDGRTINGRAQFISYAVDAPSNAVRWPTPEPDATGDPR
jgi:hypothetical protein